ncbi:hypothetical protein [Candidatus Amarolinea dominans]|uniref:hypothetical protein n=1 Tax=Candidatus Amarolinea dominans TaxID=3140696 RepID=UPI0031CCC4A5
MLQRAMEYPYQSAWRICFRFEHRDALDVGLLIITGDEFTHDPESFLPAIHQGEFLLETLSELGISQAQFAAIGVSPMRISRNRVRARSRRTWPCCSGAPCAGPPILAQLGDYDLKKAETAISVGGRQRADISLETPVR